MKLRFLKTMAIALILCLSTTCNVPTTSFKTAAYLAMSTKNPITECTVHEEKVTDESGKTGKRAYISMDEDDYKSLTVKQVKEFVNDVLSEYKEKDFLYFSILFDDDRGIQFEDCNQKKGKYGILDEDGKAVVVEKTLSIDSKGYTTTEEMSEDDIAEQKSKLKDSAASTTTQSTENDYNSTTVYVSDNNKYHLKKNCSGMKNYKTMTLQEAKDQGAEACKKCFK